MTETAVFELFVRKLPPGRNFMVAAGLEQAVEFLEGLRFGDEELDWIRSSGIFKPAFAEHLARLRFTGDVHAMPEGTVFFPNEPVLRVTAPMPEAQLVESRLLNLVHFEAMVASKAARSVLAAPGKRAGRLRHAARPRRRGGPARRPRRLPRRVRRHARWRSPARASASRCSAPWRIPSCRRTTASRPRSLHFARAFPDHALLLIDTYDTVAAARKVAVLAPELAREGIAVRGVRLDSGDLAAARARRARASSMRPA